MGQSIAAIGPRDPATSRRCVSAAAGGSAELPPLRLLAVIQFFDAVRADRTRSWLYAACSLSYLGAMVSSNSALQFVSYPTQVGQGRGAAAAPRSPPWGTPETGAVPGREEPGKNQLWSDKGGAGNQTALLVGLVFVGLVAGFRSALGVQGGVRGAQPVPGPRERGELASRELGAPLQG